MSELTIDSEKHSKATDPAPPRWMVRTEKADFRRVIEARKAAGSPVLATEFDLLCDYVGIRSRVAILRRLAKIALNECGKRDEFGRLKSYPPDERHAALMVRQLDATTSLARRLAKDLKLLDEPRMEQQDEH